MTCTIGVLVYDRANFIQSCLTSISKQKYKGIDVIISVDYSQNQSQVLKVINDFINAYDGEIPIQVIAHPENIGAIKNHQFLIRQATGKYFCWVSDDDLLHEDFIITLVSVLESQNYDDVCCAFPAVRYISEHNEKKEPAIKPRMSKFEKIKIISLIRMLDFPGQCFWAQLGVIKRDFAMCHALYPVETKSNVNTYTEFFFLAKIAIVARIVFVDKELLYYRIHEGSRYVSEERNRSRIDKYVKSLQLLAQIFVVIGSIPSSHKKNMFNKFMVLLILSTNITLWPLKSVIRKLRS
ncbi:glycosyltransferase family 2 protein [Planktomarina temperata]|nr:glycosyltransferase [Planktomarina temperata]MDC1094169.1 glycosyltransferase family 2 protein [Planktomarina temperata]